MHMHWMTISDCILYAFDSLSWDVSLEYIVTIMADAWLYVTDGKWWAGSTILMGNLWASAYIAFECGNIYIRALLSQTHIRKSDFDVCEQQRYC